MSSIGDSMGLVERNGGFQMGGTENETNWPGQ